MNKLKFGCEIYPISEYSDRVNRKFIFLRWGGNCLSEYAEVAVIQINGNGKTSGHFNESGNWVEYNEENLENTEWIHKNKIKPI